MAALITGGLLASIAVLEETGWIDLDWTSVEGTSATPSQRHSRALKDSNTSSPGISRQQGQERSECFSDFGKSSKQSQTQGLLTNKKYALLFTIGHINQLFFDLRSFLNRFFI